MNITKNKVVAKTMKQKELIFRCESGENRETERL